MIQRWIANDKINRIFEGAWSKIFKLNIARAYLGLPATSMMERFTNIVVVEKLSIINVCWSPGYTLRWYQEKNPFFKKKLKFKRMLLHNDIF